MNNSPKTILITGGAGFIGSHLAETLLRQGHRISILDNFNNYYDPEIKRRNIESFQGEIILVEGDIRDHDLTERLFSGSHFDTIIHLAARAGVRPSLMDPELYQDVNVRGTLNLLELSRKHKVDKFIMASSSSVYGNCTNVPFREEETDLVQISPYGTSKRLAEHYGSVYHHLHDMNITALRLFTAYGPRQRPDMAIHKFVHLINKEEPIEMFGNGNTRRDYTYIDDIVQGVINAITGPDGYHIYNLGESNTITLTNLIATIEQIMEKKAHINVKEEQPGDVTQTFADISKARAELNYNPSTDIETGIRKFIEWFREQS